MEFVPWWHGCQGLPRSAKAGDEIDSHPLNTKCLQRRNRQIQDNLHLVRPIARHYALQTGLEQDDLLQVGCLGLIKASNRFETKRGTTFPSFAKPHIRGAILLFLRDKVGVIRLPRAVEERAMRMLRNPEGCLNGSFTSTAASTTGWSSTMTWSTTPRRESNWSHVKKRGRGFEQCS